MNRLIIPSAMALALLVGGFSSSPTMALHEASHQVGIAAWTIDGEPVELREERLSDDVAGVPEVQTRSRITYLVRVVDQADDLAIELGFNDPGHAYVLGSASGGTCQLPAQVAPGTFRQDCVVTVGDTGSGDLFVTFEITTPSTDQCGAPAGEPHVATLIVAEPQRHASDVHVCASERSVPDTAMSPSVHEMSNAAIALVAVVLVLGGVALLPRRR